MNTERSLRDDLAALGVEPNTTMIVHSSLGAIGWVPGGAPTVVRALLAAIGDDGTLAMPTATPLCADPHDWPAGAAPDVPLDRLREELPVFDPDTTPTSLGIIPETFRRWPGTRRSRHPLESVCARGPSAATITRDHPLAFSEGEDGPFGRLHELDARVLLLGVGFNRCTALHFAESLASTRRVMTVRFPTVEDGRRVWHEVENIGDDNETHFPIVGDRYLETGDVRRGLVGRAPSLLFSMRSLVTFAVPYFERSL